MCLSFGSAGAYLGVAAGVCLRRETLAVGRAWALWQWVGRPGVTVWVCFCEWVFGGGSILGVDWGYVYVFWGALVHVCVRAGGLWALSVFVQVGVSGVRMWMYLGANGRVDVVCVHAHIRVGGGVQFVSV